MKGGAGAPRVFLARSVLAHLVETEGAGRKELKAGASTTEADSLATWEKYPTSLQTEAEVHGGWQWIHFYNFS